MKMDDDTPFCRRSEAANLTRAVIVASGKLPSPELVKELLIIFYTFLVQDDIVYSTEGENIICLKRGE